MPDPTQFEAHAETLLRAVGRHEFAAAEAAARDYARLLAAALPEMVPADAEALLRNALEAIETARRCLRATRTRFAEELLRLGRLSCYRENPAAIHSWKLEC
jgi:hypothetical protein